MSLSVTQLDLVNFRNYQELSCENLSQLNIFVGPNAVGKTNIIESIDLLTSISSFRNARAADLVGPAETFAKAKACIVGDDRALSFELRIVDGKKKYLYNGKEKPANKLRGIIPSVAFTPDDLVLIKGSNTNRRAALDKLGSQLAPSYPVVKRDFELALRQKNNLLKEGAPLSFLESIDEVFTVYAAQLYCYRVSLFEKLLPHISSYYGDISHRGEVVTAKYIPSWANENVSCETPPASMTGSLHQGDSPECNDVSLDPHDKNQVREAMYRAIVSQRSREMSAHRSFIGPHRDAVRFYVDGRDASLFASQGQQRSLVLAWKLAEVRLVQEMLNVKPLLLLDDVMSELDETRRNELAKYVLESTQTFITTTNIGYFTSDLLEMAHVIPLDYRKKGE